MKWIGYWMLGIAVLHTGLAIQLYSPIYKDFITGGLINTVGTEDHRLALWFIVAGLLMFLLGRCFLIMKAAPISIGIILCFIGLIGGLLIPLSGFWLLIPPAIALLFFRPHPTDVKKQ